MAITKWIGTKSLSLHGLKLLAKSRGIKEYENKSEGELIKILSKQKQKISPF